MKALLPTSLLLASATLVWAVPSEINYQGRLTDANGDAVTGDVAMSLKMFDAATDGNEIYSEDIGTVTLDSNGIYSFEFGAAGQSVVSTSESIATTDDTNQVYNATLENLPVDGSVIVSDGTYSWSQANGSSSSMEFSASVTPSNGAVSAIYLGSAPTASIDITASYNYLDATLSGALSSHANHWLELSVDGTAQSPRERVLSVPFAQVAGSANQNPRLESKINKILLGLHGRLRTAFTTNDGLPLDNLTNVNKGENATVDFTIVTASTYIRSLSLGVKAFRNDSLVVTFNYIDGMQTSQFVEDFDLRYNGYNTKLVKNPTLEKQVSSISVSGISSNLRVTTYDLCQMSEGQKSYIMEGPLAVGQWNLAMQPNLNSAFYEYDLIINLYNDTDELIASISEDTPSFNLKTPQNLDEVQITWSISGPPTNTGTTAISGFSLLGPF